MQIICETALISRRRELCWALVAFRTVRLFLCVVSPDSASCRSEWPCDAFLCAQSSTVRSEDLNENERHSAYIALSSDGNSEDHSQHVNRLPLRDECDSLESEFKYY